MICAANHQLRKHHCPVSVHSTIRCPNFSTQRGGSLDDERIGRLIKGGCRGHADCIVAVAQFRQCKASNVVERVDATQEEIVVTLCAKFENCPTKEIELFYR